MINITQYGLYDWTMINGPASNSPVLWQSVLYVWNEHKRAQYDMSMDSLRTVVETHAVYEAQHLRKHNILLGQSSSSQHEMLTV